MRAWVFQDYRQRKKLGEKAPWSVGWIDPKGKRRSKTIGSKSRADKFARKIEGQLASGTYADLSRAPWNSFIDEYRQKVLATKETPTREVTEIAISHFERIIKPVRIATIDTKTIDDYKAARQQESNRRGKRLKSAEASRPSQNVSPATVNRELRTLRAILRKAVKWKYLAEAPDFDFLKEPRKLVTYVTPEDFRCIYAASSGAQQPSGYAFEPQDWWHGLLLTAYLTGWRIGSLLALRWEDVDLEAGTALSRAADNKGKRDQLLPLHSAVIEHLGRLKGFQTFVFPWPHDRRKLFKEFHAIQKAAGVRPAGGKLRYGFHDLRRAFATMNAERLSVDALQALMQHRDYKTTQRYIEFARQLKPAVQNLFVPDVQQHA